MQRLIYDISANWPQYLVILGFLVGFFWWIYQSQTEVARGLRKTLLVPWHLVRGHLLTLTYFFKPKFTVQYPYQRVDAAPYYRGRHFHIVEEDGRIRCDACTLCARVCPTSVIDLTGVGKGEDKRPETYTINLVACLFCGLCVDICPEDAIKMVRDYELAQPYRNDAYAHEGEEPLVLTLPDMLIFKDALFPDGRYREWQKELLRLRQMEKEKKREAEAAAS